MKKHILLFAFLLFACTIKVMAQSTAHYVTTEDSSYFWTDYYPNVNTLVKAHFELLDETDGAVFGCRTAEGNWASTFMLRHGNGEMGGQTGESDNTKRQGVDAKDAAGNYNPYYVMLSSGKMYIDNSKFTKIAKYVNSWTPNSDLQSVADMCIGYLGQASVGNKKNVAYNVNNGKQPFHKDIRLYEFVIQENNSIMRHLYPANDNGYAGLYDSFSDTYMDKKDGNTHLTVSQDSCAHRFVTYTGSGQVTCRICAKEIDWKEWAGKHPTDCGITVVDPYFDTDNLDENGEVQQILYITSANKMSEVYVIDSLTNTIVATATNVSPELTKKLILPNTDKQRTLFICARTRCAESYGGATDSVYVFSSLKLTQKPFHQIHDVTVVQKQDIQADGTRKPYNEIQWTINDPASSDLIADEFIVYRAFKSDFSDEEPLQDGTVSLTGYQNIAEGKGSFSLTDKSDEGQYNPYKKSQQYSVNAELEKILASSDLSTIDKHQIRTFYNASAKVYYHITRAMPYQLWGDAAKCYSVKDSVTLHNLLPPVTGIAVEKTTDWNSDKKVLIHVSMKNPYVWQHGNYTDTAKVKSLIPDALKFRRYVWDENTDITIKRFSPATDYDTTHSPAVDAAAETLTIKGSDVKWNAATGYYEATIEDVQSLPYTHYYYTAELDTTKSIFPAGTRTYLPRTTDSEADSCYSKSVASVTDFTATQGTANGSVEMEWHLGLSMSSVGGSSLRITRREYKGLDDTTKKVEYGEEQVFSLDNTSTSYKDETAVPGHVYEYVLTSIFTYRGKDYTTETSTLGWASHTGYISGKVLLPNGTAVRGAKVYVRSNDAVEIPDVKSETGETIMRGVHYTSYNKELVTDEYGAYADSVDFHANGTLYTISVVYGTSSFTYNGNATAEIPLSNKRWEYTDVNMVSTTDYKFSGNVLYENSTIPVRNARFELIHYDENRNVTSREFLRDKNGDVIVTDQMGAFSISLLPVRAALRVVKEGHTMKDGGFIQIDGDTVFVPQKQQDGLRLWDQTTVRMIGRIVGGNKQGQLPLGKGKSRNNLGDNLTVILQLEGDNTSQIVYYRDAPDNTTIKKTVEHPVYSATGKSLGYKTQVTYERKRIVIKPDSITGEFFVDLAPAKYKVTQLSAEGYASLYQSGEGFDVLDYVDSVGTAQYNRVYHVPATVTYTQYSLGKQTKYIGEKTISQKNLKNVTTTMVVASDSLYTFGHPVFQSGKNYLIKTTVHEDYYYNNDSLSGKVDMVNLDGGTLHVRNGMLAENTDKTYPIDTLGQATLYITADTPDFTGTGAEALRTLDMQVEYKDYYYNAKPLYAYVLGDKYMGADILPIASTVDVVDVIHDPYGSHSYAYREKGTTYHWKYSADGNKHWDYVVEGTLGYGWKLAIGFGTSVISDYTATVNGGFTFSTGGTSTKNMTEYNMTLNERISTSSDPADVGAMADVYVGKIDTYAATEEASVSIIDQDSYDMVKTSIEHGNTKLIATGADANGRKFYLVRGTKVVIGKSRTATFAYSQKHIINTIIPDLQKKFWDIVSTGSKDSIQKVADSDKKVHYWYNDTTQMAEEIDPEGYSDDHVNMADSIRNAIIAWKQVIYDNESSKVTAMSKSPYKTYSLADTQIDYTEAASGYNETFEWNPKGDWTFNGAGLDGGKNPSDQKKGAAPDAGNDDRSIGFSGGGVILSLSAKLQRAISDSETREYYTMKSAGYGFVLSGNDNGYMDMDVYRSNAAEAIENSAAESVEDRIDSQEGTGATITTNASADVSGIHNFVFILRGGATRQPWYAADSTLYYNPGTALGQGTLKIDNPKIYIASPVVSNKPEDESAQFRVRLTNDTEVTGNVSAYNPSSFYLYLDDKTNPNGLQLFMDGAAIGSGRQIYLAPGESVEKVLEVKKGIGYSFSDVRLRFCDAAQSLEDAACFTVNYLPMATKVNISSPTDQWVINTLSPEDEDGHYIPVSIDGFDVNSDGFHHIELQYKKSTDSDTQWTTLCSFFNSDSLYEAATGVRQKINNGKVTAVRFHGEQDPMEMKYDLRAVAFRQLGTGFTTRASSVTSGTKDTRFPEIYGTPTPASGILTYDDDIKMSFTEPIAYNYLSKITNFQVQGYTNNSDIKLSSSLHFPGNDTQQAVTTVDRNLNKNSFTIDMMVKTSDPVQGGKDGMVFFSHGTPEDNMAFGITDDGRLFSRISGNMSYSTALSTLGIDLTKSLTHVGMIYHSETGTVSFFAGGGIITTDSYKTADEGYTASGKVSLGRDIDTASGLSPFKGNMLEVRLWNQELSENNIAAYNGKRLSGYETQLLAHWPMTETSGNNVRDNAHGGNIELSGGITWENVKGYSLKTQNAPVQLNTDLITASADADNTLAFWFKVDSLKGDSAALFTASTPMSLSRRFFIGFRKGNMAVVSNGNTYTVASTAEVNDRQWHHFAMTVNRSQDLFCTFLDGTLRNETVASGVGGVASDYCALGDDSLSAHFDVFSRWEQAVPKYLIQSIYNTRYSGREMGLKAYLPFTTEAETEQGVIYSDSCVYNCTYSQDENGVWKKSSVRMVTGGFDASRNLDKTEHAPVRELPTLENLDFSWTSTATALQLNINRPARDINKQTVMVTVRGVEDEYGNVMQSPQMLSYFVDKNVLRWDVQSKEMECKADENASTTVSWHNVSGKRTSFTIDGLPSWLHADYEEGTVEPEQEKSLLLYSDAGLAAGSYDAVIYLTDGDGLSDPLSVSLTVKPDDCEWEVDHTRFDRTMNLRAVVKTKNCNGNYIIDSDSGDKVGAFIANVCVGVENIASDGNLYMTIYGDTVYAKGKRNISFRLWNHETGEISELVYMPSEGKYGNITFCTNSIVGLPPADAVQLVASERRVQSLSLARGWNWVSFNVQPDAVEGVNSVFINDNELFSDGDIIKHVDFSQYSEKTHDWLGNLNKTDYHNVYHIYVDKAGTYQLMGTQLADEDLVVPVKRGWNDAPYLLEASASINDALADFLVGDKAVTGDIIKGMNQFAVADGTDGKMKWVGTLKYMQPGIGYYIYHKGDSTSYKYQRNVIVRQTTAAAKTSCSATLTETNMPVIATIAESAMTEPGDTIVAIVNGNVVGKQPLCSADSQSRAYTSEADGANPANTLFLSVNAYNGNAVTFGLCRDGQILCTTSKALTYNADAVVGSLEEPYVIDFSPSPSSGEDKGEVYDLSGRKISGTDALPRGVYIYGDGTKVAK